MAATRNDWKTTPFPSSRATLLLDRLCTANEFDRIKRGSVPREMEDKWFAFYEEPWLYLHRSWTGFGIYQVWFEPVDGSTRVAEALVSRDPDQYRSTDTTRDTLILALLLDEYAGRDTEEGWKQYVISMRHPG